MSSFSALNPSIYLNMDQTISSVRWKVIRKHRTVPGDMKTTIRKKGKKTLLFYHNLRTLFNMDYHHRRRRLLRHRQRNTNPPVVLE